MASQKVLARLALEISAKTTEFNKAMNDLSQKSSAAGKSLNNSFGGLKNINSMALGLAGTLGVTVGAYETFNNIIQSSDRLADKYEVTMGSVKNGIDSIWLSLANRDWKNAWFNFRSGMEAGKEFSQYKADYADIMPSLGLYQTKVDTRTAELLTTARDREKNVSERKDALKEALSINEAFYKEDNRIQKEFLDKQIDAVLSKSTKISDLNRGLLEEFINNFYRLEEWKKELPENIRGDIEYFEKNMPNDMAAIISAYQQYYTVGKKWAEFQKLVFQYNRSIVRDEQKVKESYEESLQALEEYRKAQVTVDVTNGELDFSTKEAPAPTADPDYITAEGSYNDLTQQLNDLQMMQDHLKIGSEGWLKLQTEIDAVKVKLDESNGALSDFDQLMGQKIISSAELFGEALGKSFRDGEEGFKNLGKTIINITKDIIGAAIAQGIATIVAKVFENTKNPWLGLVLAPAAGAAAAAVFNAVIPSFATGGTMPYDGLALVGEQGPELVNLPAGARIYNNSQSANMLNAANNQLTFKLVGKDFVAAYDINKMYQNIG